MAEKTAKTVNYTPEQTAVLVSRYVDEKVSIDALAKEFGKTARSIVAKLSREGVYQKKEYVSKTGEKPAKKDALADVLGKIAGLTEAETTSLEKVNKTALVKLIAAIQANGTVSDETGQFE